MQNTPTCRTAHNPCLVAQLHKRNCIGFAKVRLLLGSLTHSHYPSSLLGQQTAPCSRSSLTADKQATGRELSTDHLKVMSASQVPHGMRQPTPVRMHAHSVCNRRGILGPTQAARLVFAPDQPITIKTGHHTTNTSNKASSLLSTRATRQQLEFARMMHSLWVTNP